MFCPCSENKGADQLCSYCEADLRLCFRISKIPVFSRCSSCNLYRDPRDPDFPFSRRRRDPFDRFGRDPFDSDSDDDDEMSDLMRMAFRHRGRGPEGDMDRRMMEMLIRGKGKLNHASRDGLTPDSPFIW